MTEPPSKEEIFQTALAKLTAEERAAYLVGVCGENEGLHRRMERLLAAHMRAGRFLERPIEAAADLAAFAPSPEPVGQEVAPRDELSLHFLTPSSRPGSLGRLGHYEILEVVGQGGMGIVLRAFDEKLHRHVAIKTLAPAIFGTSRRRFVREARAAAAIDHDNVIAIHVVEDDGPIPYIVMPFVDGCTLQQRLDRDGALSVLNVLRIGLQIADGLAAAHAQGLVHRDIKPSNILLEHGLERVKITDFGLAQAVNDPSLTQLGLIAGTPLYMSPEQANGEHVDHRSDLFSLGSVLYTLCTGDAPFRATTTIAVLKRVCDDHPRPLREVNPAIPDWLESLIAGLHAKGPAGRIQTAAHVAEQLSQRLAELQQSKPVPLPSSARPIGPPSLRASNQLRWLSASAAIVLLAAGLGASEAAGIINVRSMVVRLFTSDGIMVVEVDDPTVSVAIDGTDLVITGTGAREIRLKPGDYHVQARKDGKVVRRELVTVTRDGRRVVRISKESDSLINAITWERSVANLPPEKQVEAVSRRLQELNPGFDGKVTSTLANGKVNFLRFSTGQVDDISPVRAIRKLRTLQCDGDLMLPGKLSDLTPLRGMPLTTLNFANNPVSDLEPLRGMPLTVLVCGATPITDLSPLKGMHLQVLLVQMTRVSDLNPLRGMPLWWLDLFATSGVSDLGPLKGMPLQYLNLGKLPISDLAPLAGHTTLRQLILDEMPFTDLTPIKNLTLDNLSISGTQVTDLTPIKKMAPSSIRLDDRPDREDLLRSLPGLKIINEKPAAEFWKSVAGESSGSR